MFTKTFGSKVEASACDVFLRAQGLTPSLAIAPKPERGWILRVDDSALSDKEKDQLLDFMYVKATERQADLALRQAEFEQLDLPSLDELWEAPDALQPDEIEKLLQVIRSRRSIDGRAKALPEVCPHCLMVGNACTCPRRQDI